MKESFTEGYLDDAVGNVALIGAGEAAKVFIQWSKCSQFDVFTTTGGGEFQGKEIASISELSHLAQYDHIVIASQFVDEIVDEWLKVKKPTGSLYWFDFMYLRMANVESMSYNKEEKKSLYVLYDLEVLPATFDIATFLVRAELRRKELALDDLVLVVIGGNFGGLSARAYLNHGATQGEWRVHHVLLPIAQMLSSCSGVAYFSNKRQANKLVNNEFTFPEDSSNRADFYLYALAPLQMEFEQGNEVRLLEATKQARIYVNQFLLANNINEPFVTISLREYGHQNSRNTSLNIYEHISRLCLNQNMKVVVVRDTNKALEKSIGWSDVVECPVASFDIAIRMALYEAAFFNASVSSGPSCGLMLLSKNCDFMMTHIIENSQWCSSEEFLKDRQGIQKGEQFSFSSEFQKICWELDEFAIIDEFKGLLTKKLSTVKS